MPGIAMVVALAVSAACAPIAGATSADCGQRGCILLIEVDGLEPGDVSATDTPFLWALAHPNHDDDDETDVDGAAAEQALSERNGFMWQAARAPMTTGTAPSAVTLLTGANPETHGVLADEMLDTTVDPTEPELRRLRPVKDQGGGVARPLDGISSQTSTLFELAANTPGTPLVAAYIGNPALYTLLSDELLNADRTWKPDARSGSDPSLCPIPRTVPVSQGSGLGNDVQGTLERDCPARDAVTLAQAFQSLTSTSKTAVFTYIHLAELGRVKQLDGAQEAAKTVAQLDAQLGAFILGLSQHINSRDGFTRTVIAVTGNHGYEDTPVTQRVPSPDEGAADFAEWVKEAGDGKTTQFVGQGTIGTVYWPDATAEDLDALADDIEDACECIDEAVPVASLAELHETWHLNPLTEDGIPSGAGGQLLVTTAPGWAFGRVTPGQAPADAESDLDRYAVEATNPYLASTGGPRNRAIALIMNGPKAGLQHPIKQVDGDEMTVKSGPDTRCGTSGGVADDEANDPTRMDDDANAPGHECQAETVDLALSLAGMLEVGLGAQQAPHARFLNEAFSRPLGAKDEEPVVPDEIPTPEPPPDPPPVIIRRASVQQIAPPPPRDPFPFRGLIRRLRVNVTDANGRTFKMAKRGASFSTIQVQADFGKPESLVTLTFYKRAGGGRRAKLSAIARFKPFAVKRGPVRLRLRIPRRFRPTHLGVSVQQVETVDGVRQAVGKPGGGIARIADARRLHTRKGAGRRRLR
jgi:hypothetical protein